MNKDAINTVECLGEEEKNSFPLTSNVQFLGPVNETDKDRLTGEKFITQ